LRSAVSNARIALPNFYNVAIRIANVAARLAVLGLRLGDELGSSTSPKLITGLNICNADIHKAADCIGVGGDAERYRWFVGCRTASRVDQEPSVRDLDVPWRAAAVASAQNATSEDLFIKSKRSLDVGDGEKVCDGKSILRRHLIAFLVDLYLAHRRLQFGYAITLFPQICLAECFSNEPWTRSQSRNGRLILARAADYAFG
jgi:hypothetical protein